ncbi:hypothetical protein BZZ01_26645 [Nostocales cyanobacterium HT-58-2]|nr:hypothetical protein BZZ01_26645 [Nostocales cyanobacterium HT-58-2]
MAATCSRDALLLRRRYCVACFPVRGTGDAPDVATATKSAVACGGASEGTQGSHASRYNGGFGVPTKEPAAWAGFPT